MGTLYSGAAAKESKQRKERKEGMGEKKRKKGRGKKKKKNSKLEPYPERKRVQQKTSNQTLSNPSECKYMRD